VDLSRKYLIINSDDLGLSHSVNTATFQALEEGAISCASVMVPGPWFAEAASEIRRHPEWDIGLHLTVTSEWSGCRWGPLSPRAAVSSLCDSDGYLWPTTRMFASRAKSAEIEIELRAQFERALCSGVFPTHVDCHLHALDIRPELLALYRKVAREYEVPCRLDAHSGVLPPTMAAVLNLDHDSRIARWAALYSAMIQKSTLGLNELVLHLAFEDDEMKAFTSKTVAYGARWRSTDREAIRDASFQNALARSGLERAGWALAQENVPTRLSRWENVPDCLDIGDCGRRGGLPENDSASSFEEVRPSIEQLRVDAVLRSFDLGMRRLLYVGKEQAHFATLFSPLAMSVSAITENGATADASISALPNYRVYLTDKYNPRLVTQLGKKFHVIVDTHLTGGVCCERHLSQLILNYADLLEDGGLLVTHRPSTRSSAEHREGGYSVTYTQLRQVSDNAALTLRHLRGPVYGLVR
jgi:predicted glycoside hydrolase/deacetylase ChbG (UPF0249 family)